MFGGDPVGDRLVGFCSWRWTRETPMSRKFGGPGPPRGEKMGVKLFSFPPLLQNPFPRSRYFEGFEVVW